MCRQGRDKVDARAFTLIELLVVISIIALLLAMLMPAMGKAREQARKVTCQANLKHQTIACHMYMGDYDQYFPTLKVVDPYFAWGGVEGREDTDVRVERALNRYMGTQPRIPNSSGNTGAKVFKCPSDRGTIGTSHWPARQPTTWDDLGCSYFYICCALNNDWSLGLYGKKVSQVKAPSKCLLVGDNSVMTYYHGFGSEPGDDPFQIVYWHHKRELGWANVAYVDFHIDSIQMTCDDPENRGYNFQTGAGWTVLYNNTRDR